MNSTLSPNVLAAFNFTRSSVLKDNIYFGQYTQYTGGGYAYKLNPGSTQVLNDLLALQQLNWIDKRTRAVFIEFALYNPNLNFFSYCELLFEIIPSGNILPSAKFIPTNLWSTSREVAVTGCLAGYLVVIIVLITVEIRSLKKKGLSYFAQFWPLIDWNLIACSWTALPMYLYKLTASNDIMNEMSKSSIQTNLNMSTLSNQNEILRIMLAICSFIATIKSIRLLRFDSSLQYLIETIRTCISCLISFLFVFFILWLAYVQLMYLLYNKISYNYSTFSKSMITAFLFLFGGPFLQPILDCLKMNYALGAIILSTYICTVILFLYNNMTILIEETFNLVRMKSNKNKNNKSLAGHLMSKFKKDKQDETKPLKYYDICDIFKLRAFELIDSLKTIIQVEQRSLQLINELIEELNE